MSSNPLRTHPDWFILVATIMLCAIGGLVWLISTNIHAKPSPTHIPQSYDPYDNDLSRIISPPSEFPPPAKEQRGYYRTYQAGDVWYSIEKIQTNPQRNAYFGAQIFKINLYNAVDTTTRTDIHSTLGCIAQEHPHYHQTDVSPSSVELSPYGKTSFQIELDYSCVYLGTADKQYFWYIH